MASALWFCRTSGCGRGAELIFLLLGIERLLGIVHCGLGGGYTGAVLLHSKLGVADFDADLVFDLLQAHLGLLIFQFRADLHGLGGAVAQRDVELQANALVGVRGVHQLVESSSDSR